MRYVLPLLLCLTLISCDQPVARLKIDPATPPSGEEAIRVLLKNQSFPLRGTGCGSGPNDQNTLQDLLVMVLGEALNVEADEKEMLKVTGSRVKKKLVLTGGCKAEPFDLKSGSTIDGWRCHLYVNTQFDGKAALGMSIAFGLRKDNKEFITDSITPNTLVCIP